LFGPAVVIARGGGPVRTTYAARELRTGTMRKTCLAAAAALFTITTGLDVGAAMYVASYAQQGSKLGPDNVSRSNFGSSVSLQSDGNRVIIGGPADLSNRGAAWVFARSAGVWNQEAKLVASTAVGLGGQGQSVALSGAGDVAVVGGTLDNGNLGAAWVWTRSGTSWSEQAKLVGTGAVGSAQQGKSVAISADGNTIAVGGYQDSSSAGAVWIFARSGGVWTQQGSKLVGSGAAGIARHGTSVALSADGNTLVEGAFNDNNGIGAAWVWTRSGGTWTQQGGKLVGSDAVGPFVDQGQSVAISADGNLVAVGGFADNSSQGAVWIWTRSGGVWAQQGSKVTATGAAGAPLLGFSVSLSSDGATLVAGGYRDDNFFGAAWIFTRSGNVWTQLGSKLVGTNGVPPISPAAGLRQGWSSAISGNGSTIAVGGPNDTDLHGAVWMYASSEDSPPGPFNKVAPVNGATNHSIEPTLSWTASSGATGYEYCYDTTNDNACLSWIPVGNVLSVSISANSATQYYWQVRATNTSGTPAYADADASAFWTFATRTNAVQNGSFGTGDLTGWQSFATPDQSYIVTEASSTVLRFYRVPPPAGTSNQAVVFQNTGVSLPALEPIEARFDLGNSSDVRKRISVLIHDADFSDLSVCTFWLGAHAALASYVFRTHTTEAWSNASISFYAATAGSDGGFYEVDNVVMAHGPGQSSDRADCVDPARPTATGSDGPERLNNGDFSNGTNSWSTFGQLDYQVNAGVFEFRRPAPPDPAGVVLQPTSTAAATGTIFTAQFDLGNSSAVRKRVTVLLHDLDFSDLSACTFWLAPGQPLSPYAMRSFTTKPWTNATISIYAATVGNDTWTRLDNVSLRQTQGTQTQGTDCIEPDNGTGPTSLFTTRLFTTRLFVTRLFADDWLQRHVFVFPLQERRQVLR
jgi:hypothetical protein